MILVTGGTGYIGSHTAINLIENNYDVVLIDNFSNSYRSVLNRIKSITNKNFFFEEIDIRNISALEKLFSEYEISDVIHFAALKSVEESFSNKNLYIENNIQGTENIIKIMEKKNIKKMIFSSSAAIYGKNNNLPISETDLVNPISPYAETKLKSEKLLQQVSLRDKEWSIISLRYFNPAGAHSSYLIGENPKTSAKNIFPSLGEVAGKQDQFFQIFGDDYNTPDGTCIRDYIHINDLTAGHISALKRLNNKKGIEIINLGTGKGFSVREIINSFEVSNNIKINVKIGPRRKGDIESCYADVNRAYKLLNWQAKYNLEDMCRDYWNWKVKNEEEKL